MSARAAMTGLATMAMLAGVSVSFVGGEPRQPREKTDADRERIAAAELKRARKNARRLAEQTKNGGAK